MTWSTAVPWRGLGLLALAAVLIGCGSNDVSTEAGAPTADDSASDPGLDGPVMRHIEGFSGSGEDAEVRGVIEIEGDCLYLSFGEGAERVPVVWPASTSWDPADGRVLLANGESVGRGDAVYGGGGYYRVADVQVVAGAAAAELAGLCVDNRYGEIAVVNNQADGIAAGDGPVEDRPPAESVEIQTLDGDWLVDELMVDGTRIELDSSRPVTVVIDGTAISGTSACNQYSGSIDWSLDAGYGPFVVSTVASTKKACDPEVMSIEQAFLAALQAADSFEVADGLYVGATDLPTNFHLAPVGREE